MLHYTTLITPHHGYNWTALANALITLHYSYSSTTLHYNYSYNCNYNYTHYTTLHPAVVVRWPLQPLQPFQKTQLQSPVGPSVDTLCHMWFTTTNLSYRFPIFETSAAALVRYYWYITNMMIYSGHTSATPHCPPARFVSNSGWTLLSSLRQCWLRWNACRRCRVCRVAVGTGMWGWVESDGFLLWTPYLT